MELRLILNRLTDPFSSYDANLFSETISKWFTLADAYQTRNGIKEAQSNLLRNTPSQRAINFNMQLTSIIHYVLLAATLSLALPNQQHEARGKTPLSALYPYKLAYRLIPYARFWNRYAPALQCHSVRYNGELGSSLFIENRSGGDKTGYGTH